MLEDSDIVGCCFNIVVCVFQTSVSDDEEDLEQLRLAALQTIKKNQNPTVPNNSEALHNQKPFYKKGSKRGRGFRPIRNVSKRSFCVAFMTYN